MKPSKWFSWGLKCGIGEVKMISKEQKEILCLLKEGLTIKDFKKRLNVLSDNRTTNKVIKLFP